MNTAYWLTEDEQTRITDLVRQHADAAKSVKLQPDYESICNDSDFLINAYRTMDYIRHLPKTKRSKDEVFRKRDIHKILEEGIFPACSDFALVFRGLMIAQGIHIAYLETFHEDYLFGKAFHTHSFNRAFDGEKPTIFDPTYIKHYLGELDIFPYVIVAEGLDCWNLGISSYKDLHRFRKERLGEILTKYEGLLETYVNQRRQKIQELRKR
ncbi:MAG: hypothetical protein NT129_00220 [Candidatus Aenigmarchaeota archaeon]|nr:hypothetical protein [Candidatus Aenigmarchaeota archaeon]